MVTYLVMTGEPSSVKSKFQKAKKNFKDSLPFVPKGEIYKISANGKWAICAADAKEPDISSSLVIDNRGVFCIAGPYASGGRSVEEIFSLLLNDGVPKVFQTLSGSFNIASVSLRQKLVAFSDFTGCYPVYKHTDSSEVRIVSNSPLALSMVNDLLPDKKPLSPPVSG